MPRKGYRNITLPTRLVEAVEQAVQRHDSLYVSVSDFVKEAIRKSLKEQTGRQKKSF